MKRFFIFTPATFCKADNIINEIRAVGDEYTKWCPKRSKLEQFYLTYCKSSMGKKIDPKKMLDAYLLAMNLQAVAKNVGVHEKKITDKYTNWLYGVVTSCKSFTEFKETVLENLLDHLNGIHDKKIRKVNNLSSIPEINSNTTDNIKFQGSSLVNKTKNTYTPNGTIDDDTICQCKIM